MLTIMIAIIAVIIGTILTILKKKKESGFDIYTIKKDTHYSYRNHSLIPYKISWAPKTLRFEAIFSDGCSYDLKTIDQEDINKLYGISYGMDDHYRSVRIGWSYDNKRQLIALYAYWYTKGKRYSKYLCAVRQYEPFFVTLQLDEKLKQVDVRVQDEFNINLALETIKGIDHSSIRLKLFPYFGGNRKAPHQMKIFIREF